MNNNQIGSPMATDPGVVRNDGSFLRKVILALIFIGIIVLSLLVTMGVIKANTKPEEKKRSFNTLAVTADYAYQDDVQLNVSAQGEARARTEIDLVPEVGGKIVYVSPNFIDGGIFRKGETLIRIDDSDYKVAVIRAESNVAQAEQSLAQEIAEGEIARRDFEELGEGEPTALALRKPQRQRAEAAVQAAKAELQSANLQLQRTYVKAPFTGRVKSKASDIGQFVSPGSRLGRIFSTDIFEVRLGLTDNALGKVNLPIAFVAEDYATAPEVQLTATVGGQFQTWAGRIMRTDSSYDTQTRTLTAIVEVLDPYGEGLSDKGMPLAPGLFVQAQLTGKTYENVVVIPRDGLRPDNEVFVVDEFGVAAIKKVEVIDTSPARAVLLSGISAGELIVLSPMEKSRISMPLKAIDINNPSELLVDPTMEEWAKAKGIDMGRKPDGKGKSEDGSSAE
ncbi:MAG: efflux RND transporter periplasmic adaptor subunit [Hellea sp.]|nr:efflux RND transporter periplasmic adaptor subunit [Hellea sp.]